MKAIIVGFLMMTLSGIGCAKSSGDSGQDSAASISMARFVNPACQYNTTCKAQFVLNKALSQPLSFHWETNDNAYTLPPPQPGVIYGQPNVHYVPASGDIVFNPGETSKEIDIQNINADPTVAIAIQVLMSKCLLGSTIENCTDVF